MRTTSLDAVDNKRINCSFCKGFREFNGEVLAETRLLHWVQSSFLSRVHHLDGGRVLRGLRNLISSSAHSSVVRGHVEFQTLGSSTSDDKKSVRLKSLR